MAIPGSSAETPAGTGCRTAFQRAGVCHDLFTTQIARAHNDANVLIIGPRSSHRGQDRLIGAKIVSPALAEMITELWLATPFKGGPHQQRLDQIAALERGEPLS